MKLIFAKEAQEDLEKIYRFLAEKNESVAINLYNEVLDEVERLKTMPKMAQIEPLLSDFQKTYRSLVVHSSYKVVYYTEENSICVVTVFDCRQKPEKLRKNIRQREQ